MKVVIKVKKGSGRLFPDAIIEVMQDFKMTETFISKQMTFNEWLDGLMTELALTNAAVARHGRLDPSTISRYRSGTRIPLPIALR